MAYVLLVEDDLGIAKMMEIILATAGYEVRHFDRGMQAATCARNEIPSVILMDFNLPDIDGRTLALMLRKQLGLKAPPIVACSARSGEHEMAVAQRFGCSAFLQKPFTPTELIDIVRRYASQPALVTPGDA